MPEVGFRDPVKRPIAGLEILEDDASFLVFVGRVAPDVEVPLRAAGWSAASRLKPGMLVRCVIDDQLGDDLESSLMSRM